MTILPVVARELLVAARRPSCHRSRVLSVVISFLVLGWIYYITVTTKMPVNSQGKAVFIGLSGFGFLFGLLSGIWTTSDAISMERREDTLGLLFLTDLKPWDILFGKIAASAINSVYSLLALVPLLALPFLLGGISAESFIVASLAMLNVIFFSLSLGIYISSHSRDDRKSMFAVFAALFGVCVLPYFFLSLIKVHFPNALPIYLILSISPMTAIFTCSDLLFANYSNFFMLSPVNWRFWIMIFLPQFITHLMGWLLIWRCNHQLRSLLKPSIVHTTISKWGHAIEQWELGTAERRKARRLKLLQINPFLWFSFPYWWKSTFLWCYVVFFLSFWWIMQYMDSRNISDIEFLLTSIILINLLLKIWVIIESSAPLTRSRQNDCWELLAISPLGIQGMIQGVKLGLKRLFALPILVLITAEYIALSQCRDMTLLLGLLFLGVNAADMLALAWMGLWTSIKTPKLSQCIAKTYFWIIVLPVIPVVIAYFLLSRDLPMWGGAGFFMAGKSIKSLSPTILILLVYSISGLLFDIVLGFWRARYKLNRFVREQSAIAVASLR